MSNETRLTPEHIQSHTINGDWGSRTLGDYFDDVVRECPDKLAVVDSRSRMTYREMGNLVERIAYGLLKMGVEKEDRVAVQLPNWKEINLFYYACAKIGAIFLPIIPIFRHKELRYILPHSTAKVMVIPSEFRGFDYIKMLEEIRGEAPQLKEILVLGDRVQGDMRSLEQFMSTPWEREFPEGHLNTLKPDANDLQAIVYTSGTESEPKGVMHTHNTLIAAAQPFIDVWKVAAGRDDIIWQASPITHHTGHITAIVVPVIAQITSVIQDIFNPEEAVELIAKERCTFTLSATPFLQGLVNAKNLKEHDISCFRLFGCGGAPVPRPLALEASEKLGCQIAEIYGSTEATAITISRLDDPPEKAPWNVDGPPSPNVQVRLVDEESGKEVPRGKEGEITLKGPTVFVGYFNNPTLNERYFDEDGWFHQGDLAIMDEDGYLTITGRKKDIIIRGGQNISAREVEEMLITHPKIENVAVVAYPDERLGERVCACMILKEGETLTLEEVVDFLGQKNLAKQKLPERLEIMKEFPMTAAGKIQKFILRDEVKKRMS